MMASMETYLRTRQRQIRQWALRPGVQTGGKGLACIVWGFLFSGATLAGVSQPLVIGAVSCLRGRWALLTFLGAGTGFPLFWGAAGVQGVVWAGLGLLLSFLPQALRQEQPLLPPALAAFFTAAAGLLFQVGGQDPVTFSQYLLRVAAAAGATALFDTLAIRQDPFLQALAGGVVVLALSSLGSGGWLNPGYPAAALLAVTGPLAWSAMAGLGLDLAGITGVSMTAVLCLSCFLRLIPVSLRWYRWLTPALSALSVMVLSGRLQPQALPGLLLGGLLGALLPPRPEVVFHRGETGVAQVRLELTAEVMASMQQLLLETAQAPPDTGALLQRVQMEACDSCSARSACRDRENLKETCLEDPRYFHCRKPVRIRQALYRGQEQLRRIRSDRLRQAEYRSALIQQYQFLGSYLRDLADQLPRRAQRPRACFRVEVSARSRGKEQANGDRCLAFSGVGCRYYVLLSDGMGTGLGAAQTGQAAAVLLKQMLVAGFPPEYALRSLNSLLALQGQAGAAAVDLAELRLDSGRIRLYKWGAAPSYVLRRTGAEKIGTATAPPGIWVKDARETVLRLSLHRGEALILLSDGAEIGEILRKVGIPLEAPPGELAETLLQKGWNGEDDATVAVIRMIPANLGA